MAKQNVPKCQESQVFNRELILYWKFPNVIGRRSKDFISSPARCNSRRSINNKIERLRTFCIIASQELPF